ncbi:aryl-alcohol dehydrogenase [Solimonas aquatica]|uniref:Aryl-alcohol dehydrogenase n=1 Tax=Solimonas aquatica TaxID=489703 RepID=A0A1H9BAS0_9GAMM|nr:NAD(P)-dependent alcohol dehydrogenase [Solimonas aquatica]SEP86064.1 aryl-alcohol dehydrogenase [Solimonas aquatica]
MSSSQTAQAAVVREIGKPWVIEEVEIAAPRADEILVRMAGTGICHTDTSCKDGHFPVALPIVLGHEGAGVVEAVGSEVSRVRVGDHVVLSFDSCGHCRNCKAHHPSYCFDFYPRNVSGTRLDGSHTLSGAGGELKAAFFSQSSFATLALAREANTVVIDKDLPLEIMGPLGCGIQTGAGAAINALRLKQGDSLAVFGGGAVGLSALLGARAVDAGTVIVVEPNAGRRALALELGASHVIDPKASEDVLGQIRALCGGVNYALDTTGIPGVIAVAVEALLPDGMCGLLGVPPPEATVPANMMSMLVRGVGVKYIVEGDADPQEFIPRMAAWYRAGKFPFDRLIRKFPFAQINEAAQASLRGEVVKPVLVF